MSMVGKTYLERGEPVEVLVQWSGLAPANLGINGPVDPDKGRVVEGSAERLCYSIRAQKRARSGPRNVLIRRANGDLVVRPMRGLRKLPATSETASQEDS